MRVGLCSVIVAVSGHTQLFYESGRNSDDIFHMYRYCKLLLQAFTTVVVVVKCLTLRSNATDSWAANLVLQISRLSEGSTGQIFTTSSVIYQMKMLGLYFLKVVDVTSDSEY